ncbi:MAG: hypothetical protein NHB32_22055 [Fischerella sp. CENA71]|nr:hypothetical protein [Fischerella sp. CENA71]
MPKKNSPPQKTDSSAKNKANSPITGFRISNFKAFAGSQYIPIRPLTLIYGANSSGKSSILHSLLLAHHAITNEGELDVYRTKAGGDSVDLGGFGQYVHKRDRTRLVEWAIDLDPSNINLSDKGLGSLLEPIKKLTVGVGIGMHSSENGGIKVRSFFLEADGERVLDMSSRPKGRLQLDRLDHKHRIISPLIEAIIEAKTFKLKVTPQEEEEIEQVIKILVPKITAQVYSFLPSTIQVKNSHQANIDSITPVNPQNRQNTLADVIRLFIPYRLNDIVSAITQTVESELEKLRYLGPFRAYPPRHFAFSRQQDANWHAGGGYSWDILLNNAEVRNKVNAWLGDTDRMKTPYELRERTLLPDSHLEHKLDSLLTKSLHDFTVELVFHAAGFGENIQEEIERIITDLEDTGVANSQFWQICCLKSAVDSNSYSLMRYFFPVCIITVLSRK